MHTQISLRPYQLEALRIIETKFAQGVVRQAVSAPTGAGKTIVFAELIRRRQHLGRALVLVHRDELAQQALDKIRLVIPDASIGKVKAESNEVDAHVIVASVQTLARDNRLQQLVPNFKTVIVDEAHHVSASTYQKILTYLGCPGQQKKDILLVGLSATLERTDGLALGSTFQEIVFEIDMLQLIEQGYLVDIQAQQVTLKGIDLDNLQTRRRDFADMDLSELMERANAPWQVAEAFSQYASDRKAIVFTPSVKVAHDTAEALKSCGFRAEALDGATETKARRAILGRLATGETQIVTNCAVLTEGFDETSISCVILARPTKSKSLFVQMAGRGLRPHPSKQNCLILDCAGNASKHELISIPSLLGLDTQEQQVTSIASVADVLELRKKQGLEFINGQLVSKAIDLLAFRRRKQSINWLTLNPQFHAISIGDGNLLVIQQEQDHSWSLYTLVNRVTELVYQDLDLETATTIGEDIARQQASTLIDTNAHWRYKPASAKQLDTLRSFRAAVKQNLTMGQASDMIALHVAQRELRYIRRSA